MHLVFVAILAVVATGCAGGSEVASERRTTRFEVGASPSIKVASESGRVIVRAGPESAIAIEATLHDPPKVRFTPVQTGDNIAIDVSLVDTSLPDVLSFRVKRGADLTITAPPSTSVEIETLSGAIELTGLRSSGSLRTGNGAIKLTDVTGRYIARTSKGDADVGPFEGSIELETGNGAIDIHDATGNFQAKTVYGRLSFGGTIAPGGANHLESADGRLFVGLTRAKDLTVEASASSVNLTAPPSFTTTTRQGNRVAGSLGTGATTLTVRAANGTIELMIGE